MVQMRGLALVLLPALTGAQQQTGLLILSRRRIVSGCLTTAPSACNRSIVAPASIMHRGLVSVRGGRPSTLNRTSSEAINRSQPGLNLPVGSEPIEPLAHTRTCMLNCTTPAYRGAEGKQLTNPNSGSELCDRVIAETRWMGTERWVGLRLGLTPRSSDQ